MRRLAAILAADVVGYSALMAADEAGTLAALRQLRSEVFGPAVAGHRGRVVKSMGDGWLVEFASAVDAVSCAMQMQDRLAGHEAIRLRIGVHIGDVTHEDDDIFGDGVNVAARLEGLAEPGTVVISDAVRGALDGTLRPSFDDRGEHRLKNIDRPVRVWVRGGIGAAVQAGAGAGDGRGGFPRLAIRPVARSDDRAEVVELADALTGDLGVFLGALRWLVSSTEERPPPGGYVLNPVLRSRGDRLRLEVRLSDPAGEVCWSGRYDGELADSFDWQDATVEDIANHVPGLILEIEKRKTVGKPVEALTAAECYLRGLLSVASTSREAFTEQLTYLAAAIEKGAGPAGAYADGIFIYCAVASVGLRDLTARFTARFERWQAEAAPLAELDPLLDLSLATAAYQREGDGAQLRRSVRNALRLAPRVIEVLNFCGWSFVWLGEPEEALDCFRRCERLTRFSPWLAPMFGGAALAAVQAGRDDDAIAYARRGMEVTQDYAALWRALASAHANKGQHEEAKAALAEALRLLPDDSIAFGRRRSGYPDTPGTRRYFEGLRLAGMPEGDA
jgi:adenylate cyclase